MGCVIIEHKGIIMSKEELVVFLKNNLRVTIDVVPRHYERAAIQVTLWLADDIISREYDELPES